MDQPSPVTEPTLSVLLNHMWNKGANWWGRDILSWPLHYTTNTWLDTRMAESALTPLTDVLKLPGSAVLLAVIQSPVFLHLVALLSCRTSSPSSASSWQVGQAQKWHPSLVLTFHCPELRHKATHNCRAGGLAVCLRRMQQIQATRTLEVSLSSPFW